MQSGKRLNTDAQLSACNTNLYPQRVPYLRQTLFPVILFLNTGKVKVFENVYGNVIAISLL